MGITLSTNQPEFDSGEEIDIPPKGYKGVEAPSTLNAHQQMKLFNDNKARKMLYISLIILCGMYLLDTVCPNNSELKVPLFEAVKFLVASIIGYLFAKSGEEKST
jgi:hypothetical protein